MLSSNKDLRGTLRMNSRAGDDFDLGGDFRKSEVNIKSPRYDIKNIYQLSTPAPVKASSSVCLKKPRGSVDRTSSAAEGEH